MSDEERSHDSRNPRAASDRDTASEAARNEAEHLRQLAEEAREAHERHREALETICREREQVRERAEAARAASEKARVAADTTRHALLAEVRATAETLAMTVERMRAVEVMRRTFHERRDLDERGSK